jgi:hypothetical protein
VFQHLILLCALRALRVQIPLTQMVETAISTTIPQALANAVTQTGTNLAALSDESPLLLVFLRQFG